MVSKAKQEAAARYNKANVRRVTVIFSPLDRDIQQYLESKESMGGYLKKLLREDYEGRRSPDAEALADLLDKAAASADPAGEVRAIAERLRGETVG